MDYNADIKKYVCTEVLLVWECACVPTFSKKQYEIYRKGSY